MKLNINLQKLGRALVCLLLVCCILINCSPIKAKASVTDMYNIYVTAEWVISSLFKGLGLAPGSEPTDFSNCVNNCITAMQDTASGVYEMFDSDGRLQVYKGTSSTGAIIYYVSAGILNFVREWLFSEAVVSSFMVGNLNNGDTFDLKVGSDLVYYTLSEGPVSWFGIYTPGESTTTYYTVVAWSYKVCGNKLDVYNNSTSAAQSLTSTGNATSDLYYKASASSTDSSYFASCPIWYNYSTLGVSSLKEAIKAIVNGSATPDEYGISTEHDLTLNNVAADTLTLDEGYPTWGFHSMTYNGEKQYPIALGPTLEDTIGMSQSDVWEGTSTYVDTTTGTGSGTVVEGTVAATPWATFTEWVSAKFADVVAAVQAIPAAITDFFTFDASVDAWAISLKDFFPFCIPYDIYDFLSILAAEPEAPVFHWEIPVPQLGKTFELDVDLSAWDDVARLFRSLELLAFIVGLAYVTREKFIRG